MEPPADASKPIVNLYVRPGAFDDEIITRAAAGLHNHADVHTGRDLVFSHDPYLFQVTLEFMVNTLSSISANLFCDVLKVLALDARRRGVEKITCRLSLRSHTETTATSQIQDVYIDIETNEPDQFAKALDTVLRDVRRPGRMFSYNPETDELDDIS